jgi:glycosyltransferase involved in cell wall biosynthesis
MGAWRGSVDKISVIIPAYNEEAYVSDCIRETLRALDGSACEVIVVDDGSKDGTRSAALSAAAGNGCVKVVGYEINQGKGCALKHGFAHATGEMIAFLDADMQIHPRQLLVLYGMMRTSGADVVVGCKRHARSQVDYPFFRRLVSVGYLALTRLLFGLQLKDTQTGIKLFRREVLIRVWPRISIRRFAFDLALLVGATRFNYHIVEAPISINLQRTKHGRIGIGAIARTLLDTLVIFYEASFWKWLSPGPAVKAWLMAFVCGLVAASFGVAHLLTFIDLPGPLMDVAYYLTLRFMDKQVRDWLLIGVGFVVMVAAMIQLNKYVLAAFARADSGDLASINRVANSQSSSDVWADATDGQQTRL